MATDQKKVSARSPQAQKEVKWQYLVMYNLMSMFAWALFLVRLVLILALTGGEGAHLLDRNAAPSNRSGIANAYPSNKDLLPIIQSFAVLEILHALFGFVRAGVMTTAIQVSSRLLVVWGILHLFGDNLMVERFAQKASRWLDGWGIGLGLEGPVQKNQAAYVGMVLAWSITDFIRYLYFTFHLASEDSRVPKILTWLRYNTFFLLYPVGISCECWLIYQALPYARELDQRFAWFLMAVLAIYVPGSYIMYSHMMTQRKRMIKGKQKQKTRTE